MPFVSLAQIILDTSSRHDDLTRFVVSKEEENHDMIHPLSIHLHHASVHQEHYLINQNSERSFYPWKHNLRGIDELILAAADGEFSPDHLILYP